MGGINEDVASGRLYDSVTVTSAWSTDTLGLHAHL